MTKKINKKDVKPKIDPCGLLRELCNSENVSIAHDTVLGTAKEHMHHQMEEIYYVEKGEGQLVIDKEILDITEGDLIPIPKNTWHYLKKIAGKNLEVLVITHPKYIPEDLILKKNK
ncbi:MAG: cupin domain-containing protein [Patescibacteria group bacterium]